MLNFIKNFRNDEDGAVTVDFVVLTAAIVVLGLAVGGAISSGAKDLANDIEASLDNMDAE
jgi:Flp pilus assembly pilin Flp